jgi:hypothetical protein
MKSIIQKILWKILGINFISVQIRELIKFNTDQMDISNMCLQISREDSARYVLQKMPKARIFDSAESILDFSLDCIAGDLKEGLFLEFGVWKGSSINRIAQRTQNAVYGFDSFEGLPEAWRTGYDSGKFSLKNEGLPAVLPNVKLIAGWFDQTLPEFVRNTKGDIAFLHVDCDLYSSTKTIFDHLGDRIKNGTIILFDEYFGYPTWQDHEHKAFQEFIVNSGLDYEYLGYNSRHEQVVARIIA